CAVCHGRTILELDLVQQRHDLAAPDLTNGPAAENWKRQPFKIGKAARGSALLVVESQLVAVALQPAYDLEVALNDGREGVGFVGFLFGPIILFGGSWVAAFPNLGQGMGRSLACRR